MDEELFLKWLEERKKIEESHNNNYAVDLLDLIEIYIEDGAFRKL